MSTHHDPPTPKGTWTCRAAGASLGLGTARLQAAGSVGRGPPPQTRGACHPISRRKLLPRHQAMLSQSGTWQGSWDTPTCPPIHTGNQEPRWRAGSGEHTGLAGLGPQSCPVWGKGPATGALWTLHRSEAVTSCCLRGPRGGRGGGGGAPCGGCCAEGPCAPQPCPPGPGSPSPGRRNRPRSCPEVARLGQLAGPNLHPSTPLVHGGRGSAGARPGLGRDRVRCPARALGPQGENRRLYFEGLTSAAGATARRAGVRETCPARNGTSWPRLRRAAGARGRPGGPALPEGPSRTPPKRLLGRLRAETGA